MSESNANDDQQFSDAEMTIEVTGTLEERFENRDIESTSFSDVKMEGMVKEILTLTQHLGLSLINADAFLSPNWAENQPRSIDLGSGRMFYPDYSTAQVTFDVSVESLRKAAQVRAAEDATETLYVLGNWTYLAKEESHIEESTLRVIQRAFVEEMQEADDPPDDATTEEFGGQERARNRA